MPELMKEQEQAAIELAKQWAGKRADDAGMLSRAILSLHGRLEEAEVTRKAHTAVEAEWLLVRLQRDRFRTELTEARAKLETAQEELTMVLEFWGSSVFDVRAAISRALAQITETAPTQEPKA